MRSDWFSFILPTNKTLSLIKMWHYQVIFFFFLYLLCCLGSWYTYLHKWYCFIGWNDHFSSPPSRLIISQPPPQRPSNHGSPHHYLAPLALDPPKQRRDNDNDNARLLRCDEGWGVEEEDGKREWGCCCRGTWMTKLY